MRIRWLLKIIKPIVADFLTQAQLMPNYGYVDDEAIGMVLLPHQHLKEL